MTWSRRTARIALPFYTMRFLAGRTLGAATGSYHRGRLEGSADPLEFRGLLDAFTSVCRAVAFAHARGVIHRDLKGANVVLGDFGEVFVIDWGLAKSSKPDRDPSAESSSLGPDSSSRDETVPGSVLGTPGYIAPELLEGHPADRRSDVYALGAVLYLILAGRSAYSGESPHAVIRAAREEEPEAPRSIVPDVPRALEAICLKAMSRDPSSRFGSAVELADEVRRWMADEPVESYPEPASKRLGRWARRHRSAVLAASAALVSAVVGLSIATALIWSEQQKTAREADLARRERARAEGNLDLSRKLTVDLLRIADERLSPIPGTESVRAEIFDASLRTFRNDLGQRPGEPTLRRWTAQIGRYSANVNRMLNRSEAAGSTYRESIGLLEALIAQFPGDEELRGDLASTLGDQSQLFIRLGRLEESAAVSRRAVQVAESLVADPTGRSVPGRTVASTLYNLAAIEGQLGHPAASARAGRRGVAIYEALVQAPSRPPVAFDPVMLGSCLFALATAERELGRFAEAFQVADRGVGLLREFLEKDPAENNAAHNLGRVLYERARAGLALGREGSRESAEADLSAAILGWDALAKRFPQVAVYRDWGAVARLARGASKGAPGGEEDLETARDALDALARQYADIPGYRANLGRAYLEQARLSRSAGQLDRAKGRFALAVDTMADVARKSPEDGRLRASLEAARAESASLAGGKP